MRFATQRFSRSRQNRTRTVRPAKSMLLDGLESRMFLTVATPVGVNLEPVADWSRSFMFVDAMKSARRFGSASAPWDGTAQVDANGNPTGDFGAAVITINKPTLSEQDFPSIGGTYHFSATGKATIKGVASQLNVVNQQYDSATNKTTADIVVDASAPTLYLSFTNTGGGLKDMKLIRPGYAADTTQVFTDEFVRSLAPFQTLRLMDYAQTNGNQVVNWDDRAKPTDAIQTTSKGAAWEYAIDLANQTQKDLWINIPSHASDDYVHHLAELLHNELDSNLNVYVEYSNEVWNSGFEQFHANVDAATAEGTANPSVLDYDGIGNVYQWGWRRTVERLEHARDIFADVYGEAAMNKTVRPVLASQIGWNYVVRDQLNFLEHFYGKPSDTIYAIAGAPYLNIGDLSNDPTLTTDRVLDKLESGVSDLKAAIARYTSLATYYGLKNLMYEGGIDLEGDTLGNFAAAKLPANYDPRISQIMTDYLNGVYADGADQLMYFTGTGAYGPFGTWGLTENVSNLTGPKYSAVINFANAATPAPNVGTLLPAVSTGGSVTLDAGAFTGDRWESTGTSGALTYPATGSTFDYLLNSQGAAYSLAIVAGSWGGGGQLEVLVDNQLVATVNPPGTHSSAMGTISNINLALPESATLSPGLHTLRLRVKDGGYSIGSLTISALGSASGFTASAVSPSQINLSWQNGQNKGYYLERSMNGVDGWTQIAATMLPGDANLDGVVNFKDMVILSNHYGQPGGWAEGNFTGAPTVDFSSFVVLSNNFGKTFDPLQVGSTSFQDSGLDAGTTYFYRVRAVAVDGVSTYLSMAWAQTVGLDDVVSAPASTPIATPIGTTTTPTATSATSTTTPSTPVTAPATITPSAPASEAPASASTPPVFVQLKDGTLVPVDGSVRVPGSNARRQVLSSNALARLDLLK
jgi:hypothetical protein